MWRAVKLLLNYQKSFKDVDIFLHGLSSCLFFCSWLLCRGKMLSRVLFFMSSIFFFLPLVALAFPPVRLRDCMFGRGTSQSPLPSCVSAACLCFWILSRQKDLRRWFTCAVKKGARMIQPPHIQSWKNVESHFEKEAHIWNTLRLPRLGLPDPSFWK